VAQSRRRPAGGALVHGFCFGLSTHRQRRGVGVTCRWCGCGQPAHSPASRGSVRSVSNSLLSTSCGGGAALSAGARFACRTAVEQVAKRSVRGGGR
jgi:hypothetical protein